MSGFHRYFCRSRNSQSGPFSDHWPPRSATHPDSVWLVSWAWTIPVRLPFLSRHDAPGRQTPRGPGGGARRWTVRLRLRRIGTFSSPLYVISPPGDRSRIFVVEQGGRIQVVRNGRRLPQPFLDISGEVVSGGEQ